GSTSSGSNLRDRLTVAVPAWMGLQRADSSPESLLHPPSEPSWQGQGTAPIDPLVGRDLLAGWLFSAVFLRDRKSLATDLHGFSRIEIADYSGGVWTISETTVTLDATFQKKEAV